MKHSVFAGRPAGGLAAVSFFDGLVFFAPVSLLVRTTAGVTVSQFFLLQAAIACTVLAAELPAGRLTDRIGYRSTIVLCEGGFLAARALLLAAFLTRSLPLFVLEAAVEGLAISFESGTRSAEQVYSKMNEEDYKHAKSLYKNVSTVENKITFPFGPDDDTLRCRMILKKLSSETFLKMKARGKAMGATVNDVIVAAYFKALFAFVKTDGKALTVPCMYDLRRYCGGHSEGLTNMIGFMPCTMDKVGDTMTETVELVKAALQPAKEDRFTGLYSLPLLKLAYTVFPQVIAEFAIKLGYTNPYIGMSNIGIVNPTEVTMNGMAPYDAFYSGAIKFKPYMQLALTTFKNEITFSTAVRVTDAEEKVFRSFLDKVVEELTTFAEGNN